MTSPHDLAHRDLAPAPVARCVTHAIRDGALWLQLNRPDALNALNSDTLHLIESALDAVQEDATVRCVVISGAGRAFCAGADLKAIHAEGTAIIWIEHVLHALNSVVTRLMVLNFGKMLMIGAPDQVMAAKEVREIYLGIEA